MKTQAIIATSVALAFSAALYPQFARAKTAKGEQAAATQAAPIPDQAEAQAMAAQMVPAQAVLDNEIDAKKIKRGQPIKATLSDTVHLKNGVELPKGTTLMGTVATDKMQENGKSTLALRFTQAEVKGGKSIAIAATIIGVAQPAYDADGGQGAPPPSDWNGTTLQVDEAGVVPGFDLHSRIAGKNSAVLVSTKKDNVKLDARTQFALALGAQTTNAMNGGE